MSTNLPEKADKTTAENPWPVRVLSQRIEEYISRMPAAWVEGQITQLTHRPGMRMAFLKLRDVDVEKSLSVTLPANALQGAGAGVQEGQRVVAWVKGEYWGKTGALQMRAAQIRPVGEGELLARIEHLKQVLRAEGLFDRSRKKPLPFLPRRVGLITGRSSDAERDVIRNARRRWPAVVFEKREVAVQGNQAASQVTAALQELDAIDDVDVIVVARGGGDLEALLPFSNETLVRAMAAARTPVVSAIGHESDTPLCDFVADVRASTPTGAATQIVPDLATELRGVAEHRERAHRVLSTTLATEAQNVPVARERVRRIVTQRIDQERQRIADLRSRPVMTDINVVLEKNRDEILRERTSARRAIRQTLERYAADLDQGRKQLRALSPQAVLDRGYAVVRQRDGSVVMDRDEVELDELLRVTVANGDFAVRPVDTHTPHS